MARNAPSAIPPPPDPDIGIGESFLGHLAFPPRNVNSLEVDPIFGGADIAGFNIAAGPRSALKALKGFFGKSAGKATPTRIVKDLDILEPTPSRRGFLNRFGPSKAAGEKEFAAGAQKVSTSSSRAAGDVPRGSPEDQAKLEEVLIRGGVKETPFGLTPDEDPAFVLAQDFSESPNVTDRLNSLFQRLTPKTGVAILDETVDATRGNFFGGLKEGIESRAKMKTRSQALGPLNPSPDPAVSPEVQEELVEVVQAIMEQKPRALGGIKDLGRGVIQSLRSLRSALGKGRGVPSSRRVVSGTAHAPDPTGALSIEQEAAEFLRRNLPSHAPGPKPKL